jgi:anti-sigma factor RsiW
MSGRRQDQELSRWLDGEASPKQAAAVEAYLEGSAEARRLRAEFAEAGERLRQLPVPDGPAPEAVWADVRRTLRLEAEHSNRRRQGAGFLVSRPLWAGGMLGVLALGITLATVFWQGGAGDAVAAVPAVVESVESDLPGAMTMVYQDEETGLTLIWVQESENQEPIHADS